jgi:hypothetical protein
MAAFDSSRPHAGGRSLAPPLRLPGFGMIAAAALVAAAALLPVVQSSTATSEGAETRRLERRRADVQAAIYAAQAEIAQLGSLERIDREARGRLGMAPAERTVMVEVRETAPAAGHVPARFLPPPAADQPQERESRLATLLARLGIR